MNPAPFLESIRTLNAAMYVASQRGPPDDMDKIRIVEDALSVLAKLSTGDRRIDEAAHSLCLSVKTSGIIAIPPRKPKAVQGFMEECKLLESALIRFSSPPN
jgi:hypothetical protein